jgi:dodecin
VQRHTLTRSLVPNRAVTRVDGAITAAVSRACSTAGGLRWFEVTEVRGHIEEGAVAHWQVGPKISFRREG